MIILDEQMRQDQRRVLADWRIRFRQIGREVALFGIKDDRIIPFLLTLKRPTFFTHDQGFSMPGSAIPNTAWSGSM